MDMGKYIRLCEWRFGEKPVKYGYVGKYRIGESAILFPDDASTRLKKPVKSRVSGV